MIFYNYNKLKLLLILAISTYFVIFFPLLVHAKIIINEIMYDPEGSDTGREWIEVYNSGTESIDLISYKIFENNINHKLTLISDTGISTLGSGDYAVIADNVEKFLVDFPNFTGILFDSAFSLNNTGEVLIMNDSDGLSVDNFEYSSELGANNNGNSLQRNNDGFWVDAKPTIGTFNNQISENINNNSSGATSTNSNSISNQSTHSGQNDLTKYVQKSQLEIGFGRNRISTINTLLDFRAEYNSSKKPRFIWNFGDGGTDKGIFAKHIYNKVGNYNVILNGILNGYQATARVKIQIINASVENVLIISGKDVDIILRNKSNSEVNLGKFILVYGDKEFIIPEDTIIDPNSEIAISHKYTKFEFDSKNNYSKILYPDGTILFEENLLIPTSTNEQMI